MSKLEPINVATHTFTQNVEFSVVNEATFSAGSPRTTRGPVVVNLDLLAILSGDTLEIRRYMGVNGGTVTACDPNPIVIQSACMYTMEFGAGAAWDVTLKITSSTSRALKYEVMQDVGNVNVASIADAAITAAAIATDAIDADAVKADAVTKIQSGLALAATALSTAQWTNPRAALLDNLDAAVSTRAPSATALSTVTWTGTLAGLIGNLDAAITSRSSSSAMSALDALVVAVGVAIADVQSRLPATLDGQGNIQAGAKTISGTAKAEIVDYVFGFVMDAGAPVDARTFAEQWRIARGVLVGRAAGLTAPAVATVETFRNADDTKDVATFTVGIDGTRTPGTLDGTP